MKPCLPFLFALLLACLKVGAIEAAFPHQQQLAPEVHVVGFADQFHSANCGWIVTSTGTMLVDLPRGMPEFKYLLEVYRSSGRRPTSLLLTHAVPEDRALIDALQKQGIGRVLLSPATYKTLFEHQNNTPRQSGVFEGFQVVQSRTNVGDFKVEVLFEPRDDCVQSGSATIYLPGCKVLFAGPLVYHGPRVPLANTDTAACSAALRQLAKRDTAHVVPGFGSWGSGELVSRQLTFLDEFRRQVGYFIAQGRPHDDLLREIRLPAGFLVWMPYDTPVAEDVEHVYAELTVPHAPFGGQPPEADKASPHALVLIGDQPHEPGHIEQGLRPVFEATGVVAHFAVDVRALSAANLARVRLLVILRDGLQRPQSPGQSDYVWMTPEQEQAVVDFVHGGGSFLNLHNSMGLYPDDGPYLRLVGGRYIGHGPLERFRVEVVDRHHPITEGVDDFSVADEQHTPPCDETKVHVLLRNRSDDGKTAPAGWAYEPGKGRLCHLANGHTRESLLHPMYQRLMRNAVQWCLRTDPTLQGAGK